MLKRTLICILHSARIWNAIYPVLGSFAERTRSLEHAI